MSLFTIPPLIVIHKAYQTKCNVLRYSWHISAVSFDIITSGRILCPTRKYFVNRNMSIRNVGVAFGLKMIYFSTFPNIEWQKMRSPHTWTGKHIIQYKVVYRHQGYSIKMSRSGEGVWERSTKTLKRADVTVKDIVCCGALRKNTAFVNNPPRINLMINKQINK